MHWHLYLYSALKRSQFYATKWRNRANYETALHVGTEYPLKQSNRLRPLPRKARAKIKVPLPVAAIFKSRRISKIKGIPFAGFLPQNSLAPFISPSVSGPLQPITRISSSELRETMTRGGGPRCDGEWVLRKRSSRETLSTSGCRASEPCDVSFYDDAITHFAGALARGRRIEWHSEAHSSLPGRIIERTLSCRVINKKKKKKQGEDRKPICLPSLTSAYASAASLRTSMLLRSGWITSDIGPLVATSCNSIYRESFASRSPPSYIIYNTRHNSTLDIIPPPRLLSSSPFPSSSPSLRLELLHHVVKAPFPAFLSDSLICEIIRSSTTPGSS